jgi:hypothetical protein
VCSAHEDAIHRAWVNAQGTEHAFGVVDGKTVNSKTLADRALYFFDVDAIDGASLSALFASDARRQIESVKPTITRLHFDGCFGIGVNVAKRFPISIVRLPR